MQKENLFFFSFPSASNFGIAKITKKREKCKRKDEDLGKKSKNESQNMRF